MISNLKSDLSNSSAPYIRTRILITMSPQANLYLPRVTSYRDRTHTSNNTSLTNISPQTFKLASQLNQTQDGWLVDLSNTQVPHKVKLLLQLEGNFGLPLTNANHNKMAIKGRNSLIASQ